MSPEPIRKRADGSIDTGYYMQRGRRLRSEAAHDVVGRIVSTVPPPTVGSEAARPRPVRFFGWLGLRRRGMIGPATPH